MAINKSMYSSKSVEWATPQNIFDTLNEYFKFEVDVCATDENHKCDKYYTIEDDGLSKDWKETIYMNPPYGREIIKWMEKAYKDSSKYGNTIVCLVPSRTDTKWWHNYAMKSSIIIFLRGRLKFGDSKNSAPFPSAIVIFNYKPLENSSISDLYNYLNNKNG